VAIGDDAPVVFLQHGLFSSADWFMAQREKSIAYQLAHKGYNVWVGNNRGTKFSMRHTKLDSSRDTKEFYDYSFFELGKYDLPANIDYVLKATGKDKVSYIGHSQGTS
jgi:pimeloyl-ACP methyl ester carboxylesterase